MPLVKLKLDDTGEILAKGWANPSKRKVGEVTADGFTVYDVADADLAKIVFGHSKLANGMVTVDADYVAPADPEPLAPQPSQQDLINANLTKQLATVTQMATTSQAAVVTLTKQVAEQASTNTEAK